MRQTTPSRRALETETVLVEDLAAGSTPARPEPVEAGSARVPTTVRRVKATIEEAVLQEGAPTRAHSEREAPETADVKPAENRGAHARRLHTMFGKVLCDGVPVRWEEHDELWEEVRSVVRRFAGRGDAEAANWMQNPDATYADGVFAHVLVAVVVTTQDRSVVAVADGLPSGHLLRSDANAAAGVSRIAHEHLGIPATLQGWRGMMVVPTACDRGERHIVLVAEARAWGVTKLENGASWRLLSEPLSRPEIDTTAPKTETDGPARITSSRALAEMKLARLRAAASEAALRVSGADALGDADAGEDATGTAE